MEVKKGVMLVVVIVGMMTGYSSSSSFKECYTKCFIFCMIEPSQTLCSCTTHCLKDCIFQEIQNDEDEHSNNLGFCKLGCSLSTCSSFSTKHTPNGEKVGICVGSCSNNCNITYKP